MSGKTKIEWATDQWNPVTGCSKVSQGCKHCYAEREWPRLSAPRAKPNIYTGRAFTDVMCHPQKLDIPLHWTKPRRIFVNSMSDLFHEDVSFEFICKVIATCIQAEHHTFQILTKRPERMLEWSMKHARERTSWPAPNVWLGVSVEDQATADERIPLLLDTPAAVRWISAEPLLGPIDLTARMQWLKQFNTPPNINWVVVGGESGPSARPMHPDWVRDLRDQCLSASVPFFFKQWGGWAPDISLESGRGDRSNSVHLSGSLIGNPAWMTRFGKNAAGRMLDGRTWDQYPA